MAQERNAFEWNDVEATPHTKAAIAAMQYLADFLVSEARRNEHAFPTADAERRALIYNFAPQFTGGDPSEIGNMQTYFFQ